MEAERQLNIFAQQLLETLRRDLRPWLGDAVTQRVDSARYVPGPAQADALAAVIDTAVRDATNRLEVLLGTDIDAQRSTPLAEIRTAVAPVTRTLLDLGFAPHAPAESPPSGLADDVFGFGPASLAEISPDAHERGLEWGAAKAFVHLARRRREGQR